MQPWSRASLAILLLTAARAAASSPAEVRVDAERLGDGVAVHARATVHAPAAIVWQVLTDYEQLPAFIPGIARSVVLERHGNELRLEQSGEARFLIFSFPIEVRYELVEAPPFSVTSRAIAGNLKRMTGRYDIQPDSDGPASHDGEAVQLRYSGVIEPSFDLPPIVGAAALRSMAEEQFAAMVAEIERRGAAGGRR